jgi:hypothetical protein
MGKKEEQTWKIHKVGKEEQTCKVYVGRRALGAGMLEMKMDGWSVLGHPTYDLLLPFVYTVAYIRPIREPVKPLPKPPPLTSEEKAKEEAEDWASLAEFLLKPPPTKAEIDKGMSEARKSLGIPEPSPGPVPLPDNIRRKPESIICRHCGVSTDKQTGTCEHCGAPLP